ncbi:MAG: sodium:solute symporter family protein, partial [Verrucomicrobiota bacterium]
HHLGCRRGRDSGLDAPHGLGEIGMTVAVVCVYLTILVLIGVVSSRRGTQSAEDYFLAGRGFGTFVLFMALFGTNITAFAMIGLPGLAYHKGVGVLGFFGAAATFWICVVFILFGYPIWNIGRRNRYLTPSQMFKDRWNSPGVGRLILTLLIFYTIPYILIGVIAGGLTLHRLSDEQISYPAGAVIITLITVFYTSLGGMRGTAWTNVFQGLVFMIFLLVACICIAHELGGASTLHQKLVETAPEKLDPWSFPPGVWATGFLIGPVSVIAFPHMFLRLMAARDSRSLKTTIAIYPWALLLLFVPTALMGVWGSVEVPGLVGKESDQIVPLLVAKLPAVLSAIGLVAILAAIMSSLDGQLLTISTLTSVDVLGERIGWSPRMIGRVVVIGLALITLVLALFRPDGIFKISKYAFSGYTLVIPIMAAAFFWPRSTAAGILTGSIAGNLLLALYHLPTLSPKLDLNLPTFGLLPVALCLILEIALIVLVSLATRPAPEDSLRKFARPFDAS